MYKGYKVRQNEWELENMELDKVKKDNPLLLLELENIELDGVKNDNQLLLLERSMN